MQSEACPERLRSGLRELENTLTKSISPRLDDRVCKLPVLNQTRLQTAKK
jgi:hypothetical protein